MTNTAHSHARRAPSLALIAAVSRNGTIGAHNALPWKLPDDLRHFRALTWDHAVIMGRRTWDSLGRPLPGRQNIVVTRRRGFAAVGAQSVESLHAALALVEMPDPAFCIGGGELYALALPHADIMYLTEIDANFDGDVCFPAYDREAWREIQREPQRAAAGFEYAFVTYARAGDPAGTRPAAREPPPIANE